jgi:heat shock protein HslJ
MSTHRPRHPLARALPAVLLPALALGACGTDDTDTRSETAGLPSTRQDVEARQWVLDGPAGTPAIEDGRPVTLAFVEDVAHGSGPCNTFRGALSIEYDALEVTDVAATNMACEPATMRAEDDWFTALEAVDHAEVDDDDRLILTGDGVRLELDAYDAADRLPGAWRILSVRSGDAIVGVSAPAAPTLTFAAGGDLTLDTDCGTVTGEWELDGDLLEVALVVPPSDECDDPAGDAELTASVVTALAAADRVEVAPGHLTILTDDDTIALVAEGDDTPDTEDDE